MSFSRPIQWYNFHADPIWPGTFKVKLKPNVFKMVVTPTGITTLQDESGVLGSPTITTATIALRCTQEMPRGVWLGPNDCSASAGERFDSSRQTAPMPSITNP